MMPTLTSAKLSLCLVTLMIGACHGSMGGRLPVGSEPGDDGGPSHFGNGGNTAIADAGSVLESNALSVHVEDRAGLTLEVVTIACAGDCVDLLAVARGGNPPYAFSWEDGTTDARRHVCPTAQSKLAVKVSDTASNTDEFEHAMQTAKTELAAEILSCDADGGICTDAGATDIKSGHYVGTLQCAASSGFSTSGLIGMDIALDAATGQASGQFWIEWVGLLGALGPLAGRLDCGAGELTASWAGDWGITIHATSEPMGTFAVASSGSDAHGDFIAHVAAGMPDVLTGSMYALAGAVGGGMPNSCAGTFTATREP